MNKGHSAFANLPLPTLGGQQLWLDRVFFAGWRVQKNLVTGRHRLLSSRDIRRARGSFKTCKDALEREKKTRGLQNPASHLVLLVHGMAGFPQTFFRLERYLRREGFFADGYNYPSLLGTLEDQAGDLNAFLNLLEEVRKITLIGHSQGGAVIRKALEEKAPWQSRIDIDGIVLIGTPNKGAALADYTKRLKTLGKFAPRVRDQLTRDYARSMKPPDVRTGLIAGTIRPGKGLNPVIEGDDDGIVGVEEVWIDGFDDRLLVPSDHFSLANRRLACEGVLRFLKGQRLAG